MKFIDVLKEEEESFYTWGPKIVKKIKDMIANEFISPEHPRTRYRFNLENSNILSHMGFVLRVDYDFDDLNNELVLIGVKMLMDSFWKNFTKDDVKKLQFSGFQFDSIRLYNRPPGDQVTNLTTNLFGFLDSKIQARMRKSHYIYDMFDVDYVDEIFSFHDNELPFTGEDIKIETEKRKHRAEQIFKLYKKGTLKGIPYNLPDYEQITAYPESFVTIRSKNDLGKDDVKLGLNYHTIIVASRIWDSNYKGELVDLTNFLKKQFRKFDIKYYDVNMHYYD